MKKNASIFYFFIFLSTLSSAQKLDFSVSEKSNKRLYPKVIGQNDDGFFVVKSYSAFNDLANQLKFGESRVDLSFIDYNMRPIWLTALELPVAEASIQNIFSFSHKLLVFYNTSTLEPNKNDFFVTHINGKDGIPLGKPQKVDEISFEKKRNKGEFFVAASRDQSKLFSFSKAPDPATQNLNLGFTVVDSQLNQVWNKKFSTGYSEQSTIIRNVMVDDEGNAFVLIISRPELRNPQSQKVKLLKVSASSESIKEFPITLGEQTVSDIEPAIDNSNKRIILGGFYSEANSFSSAGIFYVSVDIQKEEISFKAVQSFKAKFLNEFSGRSINRGNELINYSIDRLVLRNDGGAVIIAESSFVTESTNYNSYYQIYTTSYTYHFDNVLVLSVNPDGKIDWESILRKNQVSENDEGFYSSYAMLIDAGRIQLLYNKFIRKRTDVILYSVNNKGESTDKVLIRDGEDVFIMPQGGKQVSENEMVVPCLQKNKSNFLKVTFDD